MTPSLKSFLTFAAVLPLTVAVPTVKRDDVSSIKEKIYDYVIVGGGLTGLVVANRLSENSQRRFLKPYMMSHISANKVYRVCPRSGDWPNNRGH